MWFGSQAFPLLEFQAFVIISARPIAVTPKQRYTSLERCIAFAAVKTPDVAQHNQVVSSAHPSLHHTATV
jgi:hypothetical protein